MYLSVPHLLMTVDNQITDKVFLQVIFFILESTEAFLKFVSKVIDLHAFHKVHILSNKNIMYPIISVCYLNI